MTVVGLLILSLALLACIWGASEDPVLDDEGAERLEATDALRRIAEKDQAVGLNCDCSSREVDAETGEQLHYTDCEAFTAG